ncbi:MAG: hypothetical protein SPJ55_10110 [Treponema sp.]|nr:hypothetical protein [Treponema sp.]
MKKIVGILSAAAVLAASVFAADVSASVGLKSTLFESDTAGKVVVLGPLTNNQDAGHLTLFSLQYSSDVAGGGVKYWGSGDTVKFGKFNVWFKPMEGLKLSFLDNELGLFGDKYNGWEAKAVAKVNEGYGVEYSISGLTFNLNFVPEFAGKADRDACAGINEFGLKAAYAADFGSVAVIADFNNGPDKDGESVNFNSFKVGAGYSGKIADVVDLVGTVGFQYNQDGTNHFKDFAFQNRLNLLKATVSAGGNIDAFGWAVCVPATVEFVTFPKEGYYSYSLPAEFKLGLQVSASYKIGNIGLKAYFESADLFVHDTDVEESNKELNEAKKDAKEGDTIKVKEVKNNYFAGNFGVEVTGNVGAASWKVKPDLSINTKKDAEKTTFKISFETGINF